MHSVALKYLKFIFLIRYYLRKPLYPIHLSRTILIWVLYRVTETVNCAKSSSVKSLYQQIDVLRNSMLRRTMLMDHNIEKKEAFKISLKLIITATLKAKS